MTEPDKPDAARSDAVDAPLTWVADVPLLTNRVVLRAMAFALIAAYLLIVVLFAVILGIEEDLDRLPRIMVAMLLGIAGAAVLCVVVMLVVFQNRMRCRFVLDDTGFGSTIVDRRAEIGGSLAALACAGSGNAMLVGAGLAQKARLGEFTRWESVGGAVFDRARHRIILTAAGWWPAGALHCSEHTYGAVVRRVRHTLVERGIPLPV